MRGDFREICRTIRSARRRLGKQLRHVMIGDPTSENEELVQKSQVAVLLETIKAIDEALDQVVDGDLDPAEALATLQQKFGEASRLLQTKEAYQ